MFMTCRGDKFSGVDCDFSPGQQSVRTQVCTGKRKNVFRDILTGHLECMQRSSKQVNWVVFVGVRGDFFYFVVVVGDWGCAS